MDPNMPGRGIAVTTNAACILEFVCPGNFIATQVDLTGGFLPIPQHSVITSQNGGSKCKEDGHNRTFHLVDSAALKSPRQWPHICPNTFSKKNGALGQHWSGDEVARHQAPFQ